MVTVGAEHRVVWSVKWPAHQDHGLEALMITSGLNVTSANKKRRKQSASQNVQGSISLKQITLPGPSRQRSAAQVQALRV